MAIDIFNLPISKVPRGIEGKLLLIYGTNSTGKTLQACKSKNPIYLAFENGVNAIAGIPVAKMQTWSDYIDVIKKLTSKTTIEQAQQTFSTVIVDTVQVAASLCERYVCDQAGVDRLNDGNGGYGLWKEYFNEFSKQLFLLTGAGYTVIFISHEAIRTFQDEEGNEYSKIYPAGDKRTIDPVCDLVDIIAYLKPNGIDSETGKEIPSTAFLCQTKQYHARSRFDLPPYIHPFSLKNLEEELDKAIVKNGDGAVSYEEYAQTLKVERDDFDTLVDKVKIIFNRFKELKKTDVYKEVVDRMFNQKDFKISYATPKQAQVIEATILEFKEMEECKDLDI